MMKQQGFWACVSDLLLMFPLTQPLRLVLLDLLCAGGGSPQANFFDLLVMLKPTISLLCARISCIAQWLHMSVSFVCKDNALPALLACANV